MWTPTRLLPAMLFATTALAVTTACAGPVYSYRGGSAQAIEGAKDQPPAA